MAGRRRGNNRSWKTSGLTVGQVQSQHAGQGRRNVLESPTKSALVLLICAVRMTAGSWANQPDMARHCTAALAYTPGSRLKTFR